MLDACRSLDRQPANDTDPDEHEHPDHTPTVEERLLMLERQQRALGRLSATERELVRLCLIEEEPLREAARKIGLEYKCAWVRLGKAIRMLRGA